MNTEESKMLLQRMINLDPIPFYVHEEVLACLPALLAELTRSPKATMAALLRIDQNGFASS